MGAMPIQMLDLSNVTLTSSAKTALASLLEKRKLRQINLTMGKFTFTLNNKTKEVFLKKRGVTDVDIILMTSALCAVDSPLSIVDISENNDTLADSGKIEMQKMLKKVSSRRMEIIIMDVGHGVCYLY